MIFTYSDWSVANVVASFGLLIRGTMQSEGLLTPQIQSEL